jgi:hypothetical protein
MIKTWGYRILTLVVFGLFGLTWLAAINGWGLKPTATTAADRQAVRSHSARIGATYFGSGPHYGK